MSIDEYNYDYDIFILTRELEMVDKKIELIRIVMYYCRSESYKEWLNQEFYYYSTWRDMILESLGYQS
jgi:hypothetical protein